MTSKLVSTAPKMVYLASMQSPSNPKAGETVAVPAAQVAAVTV